APPRPTVASICSFPRTTSVQVAMNLGGLQEEAIFGTLQEVVLGKEQILATVGLGGAARARGGRHGEHAIRPLLEQVLDQRALARTGRTGDDQDEAEFGSGGARRGRGFHEQGAHSTFCTCSRMRSISSF